MTCAAFGADTTGFEPMTNSARMPPGSPDESSSSYADLPAVGRSDSGMPQIAAMCRRAAGSSMRAIAGQLIGLLPVLAAALPVPLSRQRAEAAERSADLPEREREIDEGEHVVHACRLLLRRRAR